MGVGDFGERRDESGVDDVFVDDIRDNTEGSDDCYRNHLERVNWLCLRYKMEGRYVGMYVYIRSRSYDICLWGYSSALPYRLH